MVLNNENYCSGPQHLWAVIGQTVCSRVAVTESGVDLSVLSALCTYLTRYIYTGGLGLWRQSCALGAGFPACVRGRGKGEGEH